MSAPTDQAAYRVHTLRRKGEVPKKYRHTLELIDERTRRVMATCDIVDRQVHSPLLITDEERRDWSMRPNRRIMPSRWIVTDPDRRVAMQFEQQILKKLANPLHKVAVSLLDGEGEEVYRLIDPRTSVPDRVFGTGPSEWIVTDRDGDGPLAKLVRLPREERPSSGLLGAMKRWAAGSDRGIVSMGRRHVFSAPVALGLHAILDELKNASAGPA